MDIKAALSAARGARSVKPRGDVLVEVTGIDEKAGAITGKIVDGTGKGQTVTFVPGGHLTMEDYLKKSRTKLTVAEEDKPGSLLRVEGIERARKSTSDPVNVRDPWTKTFQAKPNDGQVLHTGKAFRMIEVPRKDKTSETQGMLHILSLEEEAFVHTMDDLRTAMTSALETTNAFSIMCVSQTGEPLNFSYYRRGVYEEGKYILDSVEKTVETFFQNMGPEGVTALSEILENRGMSLVPMKSLRIGGDTWQAVQDVISEAKAAGKAPRGGQIDPSDFVVTGLGARFGAAVAALDSEHEREAVKQRFLSTASDAMKLAFGEKGFAGIPNAEMAKFFESCGASVMKAPEVGYAVGSVLTKPYDESNPDGNHMATKTFSVYSAQPFPQVEAFKEIRDVYYNTEMKAAVASVLEFKPGNEAKAKAESPAAEAEADAAPEETVQAEAGDDAGFNFDELFSEIDNDLADGEQAGVQV